MNSPNSTTKPAASQSVTVVTSLNPNDVLFGRGAPANFNEGNIRFRSIIQAHAEKYRNTTNRQMKDLIARTIVQTIEDRNGHFLREVKSCIEADTLGIPQGSSAWVLVDKDTVLTKVKQALRGTDRWKTDPDSPADDDFQVAATPEASDSQKCATGAAPALQESGGISRHHITSPARPNSISDGTSDDFFVTGNQAPLMHGNHLPSLPWLHMMNNSSDTTPLNSTFPDDDRIAVGCRGERQGGDSVDNRDLWRTPPQSVTIRPDSHEFAMQQCFRTASIASSNAITLPDPSFLAAAVVPPPFLSAGSSTLADATRVCLESLTPVPHDLLRGPLTSSTVDRPRNLVPRNSLSFEAAPGADARPPPPQEHTMTVTLLDYSILAVLSSHGVPAIKKVVSQIPWTTGMSVDSFVEWGRFAMKVKDACARVGDVPAWGTAAALLNSSSLDGTSRTPPPPPPPPQQETLDCMDYLIYNPKAMAKTTLELVEQLAIFSEHDHRTDGRASDAHVANAPLEEMETKVKAWLLSELVIYKRLIGLEQQLMNVSAVSTADRNIAASILTTTGDGQRHRLGSGVLPSACIVVTSLDTRAASVMFLQIAYETYRSVHSTG